MTESSCQDSSRITQSKYLPQWYSNRVNVEDHFPNPRESVNSHGSRTNHALTDSTVICRSSSTQHRMPRHRDASSQVSPLDSEGRLTSVHTGKEKEQFSIPLNSHVFQGLSPGGGRMELTLTWQTYRFLHNQYKSNTHFKVSPEYGFCC